jgi:hypothetical protein
MVTFYITTEQRRRAQDRAAELDIDKSNPPGRYPCAWDNRLNSVKRWYDYGSAEDKVGTVYFESVVDANGRPSGDVECTTEITHGPVAAELSLHSLNTTALRDHMKLVEHFLRELLDRIPKSSCPKPSDSDSDRPVLKSPSTFGCSISPH